ncbi:CoA-transferase subunit beta [bacterium]|nr:CoA-transferase subunit beta [bacterium]MCI0606621.1 CoA-transferase subunit beta [bacterium]
MDYNSNELMVCQAARQLQDRDVVFVGIGLPNMACNLARRRHAPNLVLLYESGAVGATPERLPVSIGDPSLVTNSLSICSMFDIFNFYLQGGLIDVGFLQGAQIDRFGNLNTTVVGDYQKPSVRLPGSGGACEIAILAKKVFVIAPQTKRSFPEKVDFITSPGYVDHAETRKELGMPGAGPVMVITNLGCYDFEEGEMILTSLHPGCTIEQVQENLGWKVKVSSHLKMTEEPHHEELRIIRDELDPGHLYI